MASKIKSTKEKTKKGAVNNTVQQKSSMKTSTIEVMINQDKHTKAKSASKKHNMQKQTKKINRPKQKNKKTKLSYKKDNSKILKWLGVICLIIAAGIFLFTTPLFNVTEIEVQGNNAVSREEIISLSQIKLNENMFKNIKSTIKQNVKENAYIEEVDVKNVLPNKMQIIVKERTVKFMIKLLNNYAYINSQGYILNITEQTKEVPIIYGVTTPEEEIIIGKRLNNEDLSRLEVALRIVSTCEENEISKYITSINVENISEYTMIFAEKGVTIHLGNSSNLDTKMLYVKAILQSEDGNEGEIFVNGDLNNGFQPFFRKKV